MFIELGDRTDGFDRLRPRSRPLHFSTNDYIRLRKILINRTELKLLVICAIGRAALGMQDCVARGVNRLLWVDVRR